MSENLPQPNGEASQQTVTVQVRDQKMETQYTNVFRMAGTHEELFVDFGINLQHHDQPNTVVLEFNQRMVMSFYSAKKLAVELSKVVNRYEQVYGPLQLDPRQRQIRPTSA
jgi:hypothetical protein